jgi:hypothetical protein
MYEVISGEREVGGVAVDTFKRFIYGPCVLEIEAGTNGSRTYFRIQDMKGTDIQARLTHDSRGNEDGIVVALGSSSGLTAIVEGLKFIVKVLEEQKRDIE